MPRANRHFIPGLVWHLTHRCHQREFLLKFVRDRDNYLHWLYEARKRYGLCVLDYIVTSNHVHLLVLDNGKGTIAQSIQLVAGRTAQAYNQRKGRLGAFWEDRYHATAIATDQHLHRCLVYIDLNMVRAGAVDRPEQWQHTGYREIQQPPERYRIIDLSVLCKLCGFDDVGPFQQAHRAWVSAALDAGVKGRAEYWSEAIAVGGEEFVEQVKTALRSSASHRQIERVDDVHLLREPGSAYKAHSVPENADPRPENTWFWDSNFDGSRP